MADAPGDDELCVVCSTPISGRPYALGGRVFCLEHYSKAKQSVGAWPAIWAMLGSLVILALVMPFIGAALAPQLSSALAAALGVLLAALPAIVWLIVFRRLDYLEPEPHNYLIRVMVLGALITAAVADPIRRSLFRLQAWQSNEWAWSIGIYVLTIGVLLVLAIYLTVRFSVFPSAEFDERTDGVIYGTAAGLGASVAYNVRYLLESGGSQLGVVSARMAVAALVIASIGGLVGYGLGQVRFERRSVWYLPGILLLAAGITGIFEWLNRLAAGQSLSYTPWLSLVAAALFGVLMFGTVYLLVRSSIRETLAAAN